MDSFDARQATLDLVTAFVNNNSLKAQELPSLLSDVYGAIAGFGNTSVDDVVTPFAELVQVRVEAPVPAPAAEIGIDAANEEPKAAVSIEQSLADRNYILSMITGEKLKTLARHLKRHGLDPEQYRARYHLPKDYPMVAPAYSELRRAVAKKMALGSVGRTKPASAPAAAPVAEPAAPVQQEPAKTEAKVAKALVSRKTAKKPAPKSKPDTAVAQSADASISVPAVSKPAAKGRAKLGTSKAKTTKPAAAEKPAKPVNKTESSAAPSVPSAPAPRKVRAQTRAAASTVLQKADGVVVAAPKVRRSKLKPVFNG